MRRRDLKVGMKVWWWESLGYATLLECYLVKVDALEPCAAAGNTVRVRLKGTTYLAYIGDLYLDTRVLASKIRVEASRIARCLREQTQKNIDSTDKLACRLQKRLEKS